jgi:high-affinity nickel-transport protein
VSPWFTVCALGFVLGVRHATDPDHVVAVTTLVARHRRVREAALVGAIWGLGHALTITAVGGAILLLGWVIPPRIGLSMEFSVAVMLMVLGVMAIRSAMRNVGAADAGKATVSPPHVHAHAHGDYVHSHAHTHAPERHPHDEQATPLGRLDRWFGGAGVYRVVRPLVVGIVHGLAGSAAVALLVMAAIGRSKLSLAYLLVFGLGTIVGMVMVTAAIGVPLASPRLDRPAIRRRVRFAAGALSLVFGVILAWQVGVVGGLFSTSPIWTPH